MRVCLYSFVLFVYRGLIRLAALFQVKAKLMNEGQIHVWRGLDKHFKSNCIEPLPPVNPESGTRIGYFTTDINMLPFRTDEPNVLY